MRAIGVLLIFGGLLYGILCVVSGFPWVGAPGFVVAVAGAAVLYFARRGPSLRSTALESPGLKEGQVVATSTSTSSRPSVALVLAGGRLLWDGRALSASAVEEIEELDRTCQLQWQDEKSRDAVRPALRSAGYSPSPFTAKRLSKARSQVEHGRYKAAIGTLWEVEPDARAGDREAARAIVELAGAIRDHVDDELGEECSELIVRAGEVVAPAASRSVPTVTTTASAAPILGLQIAGGVVIVVGIGLIVGNVTGAATTFAYAGFLTTLVGGAMVALGRGKAG